MTERYPVPEQDPWRNLAIKAAVLCATSWHDADMLKRADDAYAACQTLSDIEGIVPSTTERLMREAYWTVRAIGFESDEARRALHACIKLFSYARAARYKTGEAEASLAFWWREKDGL